MSFNKRTFNYLCWLSFNAIFMFVFLSGCCSSPPEAPCPIDGLLLKSTDLPGDGWVESGSRGPKSAPKRIGVERVGTLFSGYELFDGVIHEIYRTTDDQSAYRAFLDVEEEDFSLRKYRGEWKIPSELSLIQLSADEHRIGCNIYDPSGAEECNFLAQYGPYFIRLSIRQHGLQYNDVMHIVKDIDKRMEECISSK